MIDGRMVVFTAAWVLGGAILLASWSYRRWSRQPPPRLAVGLGLLLVVGGLLAIRLMT